MSMIISVVLQTTSSSFPFPLVLQFQRACCCVSSGFRPALKFRNLWTGQYQQCEQRGAQELLSRHQQDQYRFYRHHFFYHFYRKNSVLSDLWKLQGKSFLTRRMYSSRAQCNVGEAVEMIETPALLLCLDKFEENLQKMADTMKTMYPNLAFRPHAKAHKTPMIARKQIELGAVGVCCQTLTEAEAMVACGIKDVFLSNEVIGVRKLQRLASLAKSARLSVCVDNETNIEDISKAAQQFGVNLELVIEVCVGGFRCGVVAGPLVAQLAQKIQSLPAVSFKGIHCYNGINQHVRREEDRKLAVDAVVEKVKTALAALKDAGIECNYVTGGGTGTFHHEAESGVYTEVQPGSYIFMDADYGRNLDKDENYFSEFKQSLFVLSTVQSATPSERAVVDAGMKALSLDSGPPLISGSEDSQIFHNGGDEHGVVAPCGNFKVGDQVWLIPGHCDPTVNMHDWMICMRDGKVECIWPISGRGPGV